MLTLVTSEKSFGNRWVGHRRWNERRDLHRRRMALAERMAALRRTYSSAARQIVGVPHAAAKTQFYLTVNKDDQANYDIQRDLHRDTFFSAMKLWLFLRPVAAADGPFTFVLGEFRREVQHPGQICYESDAQREMVLSCQIIRI